MIMRLMRVADSIAASFVINPFAVYIDALPIPCRSLAMPDASIVVMLIQISDATLAIEPYA